MSPRPSWRRRVAIAAVWLAMIALVSLPMCTRADEPEPGRAGAHGVWWREVRR